MKHSPKPGLSQSEARELLKTFDDALKFVKQNPAPIPPGLLFPLEMMVRGLTEIAAGRVKTPGQQSGGGHE